jgi:hypothetical protein
MVGIKRDKIRRCFQLILEKRYSDARNLLKPSETYQDSSVSPGVRFAIEGIINFFNDKSKEEYLKDVDRLRKLRLSFKSKISAMQNDDFDRDYFETWIGFLNLLLRQLKSKGNVDSVVDDPREEPEGYEAT